MKELFGLKDKEGREYKILFDGEYPFKGCAIKPIESPQEFKVGDWVWIVSYKDKYKLFDCPFRIDDITPNNIAMFQLGKEAYYESLDNLRPAKAEEIESYLIKEAKKRGFVGKCKFRCTNGYLSTQLPQWDFFYLSGADALVTHVVETSSNRAVYCQGKWAEIIPQKKSLPKSKRDFEKFLNDYNESGEGNTISNFLADFED
jgi:hypothetical protein